MATQTTIGTLYKDPHETRTFYMDWSAHIGTQTITASSWTVPAGLTLQAASVLPGNNKTAVVLSGGTSRNEYFVSNQVTTSAGNIYRRTGLLIVRDL